jgi:chromosome partitioning protein
MKVISVAGPKGGVGKSLTTSCLAVHAAQETGKVAILDMDEGQGTLTEWWTLRGRPVNPYLHAAEGTLDELVDNLKADEWTYAIIDGPPHDQDLIEMTVVVADAVIIPVKLAYFDTSAIDGIKAMCERRKKPFAFLVNEYDERQLFAKSNALALRLLQGRGRILDARLSYDPKYRLGQIQGRTGPEMEGKRPGAITAEVAALWTEVKKLAGVPELKAVRGGRHA